MLRSILDTIREFIDSISMVSFEDLPQRMTLIAEAFRDPRGNPLSFFLSISVIIIVGLILFVSLVLTWLLLTKDRTNRLQYAVLDAKGSVIDRIPVEEVEKVERSSRQRWARASLRFVLISAGLALLLVSFGATTQSRSFCSSCHESTNHTESVLVGGHSEVSCIACHETNHVVQSYTTSAVTRFLHVAGGLVDAIPASGYGTVTPESCMRCHSEDIERVTDPSLLSTVRMSHAEPRTAGMGCLVCHAYNFRQEIGLPDRGMEVCLKCHNNEQASADCTVCHVKHPLSVSKGAQWDYAANLLAHTDPQQGCYRCHDPAPCDACHGVRMPHSKEFMAMQPRGHPAHSRGIDLAVCFTCHDGTSNLGATDCYLCHPRGSL